MRRRLVSLLVAGGIVLTVLGLSPSRAFGEPIVSVVERCDFATYGVEVSLSGFPPNTPFTATLTYAGGGVGPFTSSTDATGSFGGSLGSSAPMGLVTLTVVALDQTFVATVLDPCGPGGPDTTPPTVIVHPVRTADATSPGGAIVHLDAGSTDDRDPSPPVFCDPESGTRFPIGTTAVTCRATDTSGNTGTAEVEVVVHGASDQLGALRTAVGESGASASLAQRLVSRIDAALASIAIGEPHAGCRDTRRVARTLRAQRDQRIPAATADQLIRDVDRIRSALGCVPPAPPITVPTVILEPACDVSAPDVGIAGPYGVSFTLEGFAPGAVIDLAVTTGIGVGFSVQPIADLSGGWGPFLGSYTSPVGLVTVTASVEGVVVASAAIDNPCTSPPPPYGPPAAALA